MRIVSVSTAPSAKDRNLVKWSCDLCGESGESPVDEPIDHSHDSAEFEKKDAQ